MTPARRRLYLRERIPSGRVAGPAPGTVLVTTQRIWASDLRDPADVVVPSANGFYQGEVLVVLPLTEEQAKEETRKEVTENYGRRSNRFTALFPPNTNVTMTIKVPVLDQRGLTWVALLWVALDAGPNLPYLTEVEELVILRTSEDV